MQPLMIIGAGLAGSEAAWQAANRGIEVELYEMRPENNTPAHHTAKCAELVCSNSLRAANLENAVGLLKEEMRRLNSLVMESADANRVPAGGALAVDREGFSAYITDKLEGHPLIKLKRAEIKEIPQDRVVIIATGPLTSPALTEAIRKLTGEEYFYFHDAAAPIVTKESLDHTKVFAASRYDKGDADYLNCPMSCEEYESFWHELVNAEKAEVKDFEKGKFFEGCMPVEEMASRGPKTLLFGPLKPVGLTDPRTGKYPYAVVQLRQDNKAGTLYNLVGFQTQLKWGEQARVFRMIPGLEKAEFVRYGVMHRNTFINSPNLLLPTLCLKKDENIFFAGQITGVEGYLESASNGLIAGINAARKLKNLELIAFPETTAHGALCHYITTAPEKHFQPMNVTFGLFPPLEKKIKAKKERGAALAARALQALDEVKNI